MSKIRHILSVIHYTIRGAVCFQFTHFLVIIERIYVLRLIINTKSEVWTISHCLGLGHETMVCAVCLFVFLWWERRLHGHLSLQWRHNGRDSVSNHQPHDCLLNRLFRRRSKKTSKLRVTVCAGNLPGTGEFPAQMASNAENVFIWWRRHDSDEVFK